MRVKVESVAPLPHVKAWFSAQAIPTIFDLKTSLCSDLFALKDGPINPEDLVLLLDDFELLDSSPIDVVRDGDLIVVKQTPAPTQHKRKAHDQGTSSPPRKRSKTEDGKASSKPPTKTTRSKRRAPTPSSSEEEESSSGSSTDSESTSDSDSSDSDSDSSSSSSSSSLSSSSPSVKPSKRKSVNGATVSKPKLQPDARKSGPAVPPGLGKPSTHSRNLRRRRKKMYERLAATAEPTSVNEIPLGTRARTTEPFVTRPLTSPSVEPELAQIQDKGKGRARDLGEPAEPPQFLMASMQNKNKRRGFKDALSRGVPAKITFTEGNSVEVNGSQSGPVDADADAMVVEATLQVTSPTRTQQPRLVPPSEKQELGQLPPNVFVTSVDVEEGMWPSKRKNKKKKKPEESFAQEEHPYPDSLPYDDESAAALTSVPPKDVPATGMTSGEASERDAIGVMYNSLGKITDKIQVTTGATIAWTGLSINMETLTPEVILHIARVVRVDDERLDLELMSDNGAAGASFGGPIAAEDEDFEGPVVEEFSWDEIFKGDFRLVA